MYVTVIRFCNITELSLYTPSLLFAIHTTISIFQLFEKVKYPIYISIATYNAMFLILVLIISHFLKVQNLSLLQ